MQNTVIKIIVFVVFIVFIHSTLKAYCPLYSASFNNSLEMKLLIAQEKREKNILFSENEHRAGKDINIAESGDVDERNRQGQLMAQSSPSPVEDLGPAETFKYYCGTFSCEIYKAFKRIQFFVFNDMLSGVIHISANLPTKIANMKTWDVNGLHDLAGARKWYESGSKHGSIEAQNKLGMMLLNGDGGVQDFQAAAQSFQLAAQAGDGSAQNNLAWLHEVGSGDLRDWDAVALWYKRSAESKNTYGMYNYARLLFEGKHVKKDDKHALELLEEAAWLDNPHAQYFLSRVYGQGKFTKADHVLEEHWAAAAKRRGFSEEFKHPVPLLDNSFYKKANTAALLDPAQ